MVTHLGEELLGILHAVTQETGLTLPTTNGLLAASTAQTWGLPNVKLKHLQAGAGVLHAVVDQIWQAVHP